MKNLLALSCKVQVLTHEEITSDMAMPHGKGRVGTMMSAHCSLHLPTPRALYRPCVVHDLEVGVMLSILHRSSNTTAASIGWSLSSSYCGGVLFAGSAASSKDCSASLVSQWMGSAFMLSSKFCTGSVSAIGARSMLSGSCQSASWCGLMACIYTYVYIYIYIFIVVY